MTARAGEPPISPARMWLVVAAATLVMSVSYIDRQALAALAPTVKEALGISHTEYGWLSSSFSLAYLVGAPLAGVVLDRAGARRGLAWAVLLWSGVAALHAVVPSLAVLFALRILLGATETPAFPGATQTIARVLPPSLRSTGFGLLFTGSSIGAMIAAPLAVAIHAKFGWRVAFLGVAAIGLAWIPFWLFATRGALVRRLGPGEDDAGGEGEGASAGAAVGLFGLLRRPEVQRAVVLMLASAPGLMLILLWFPQMLHAQFGVAQNDMGRYAWLPPLVFDAGAVGFGVAATRLGGASPALVGVAAVLAAALVGVPQAGSAEAATVVTSVAMAGGGGLYALLTSDLMARIDPRYVARAGGLTASAQSLAYIVANPLVGAAVDRSHRYDGVALVLGALVVPGALAWVFWPRVPPPRSA